MRCLVPQGIVDLYHMVRWGNLPYMEIHGMRRESLVEFLDAHGARILDVAEDHSSGEDWVSFRYCVKKEP